MIIGFILLYKQITCYLNHITKHDITDLKLNRGLSSEEAILICNSKNVIKAPCVKQEAARLHCRLN